MQNYSKPQANSINPKVKSIVHNTILNLAGYLIPLLIGIPAMPFIIKSLGKDAFGILSLAWVIVGYFSLFDLGLGRATTKYLAQYLGKENQDDIPAVVWTSSALHLLFGIMSGFLFFLITPLLINKFLNIPSSLRSDTKQVFLLLAIAVPFVIFAGVLRGSLAAAQRFDLINVIKIPSGALNFIIPLLAIFKGCSLPVIILMLVIARLVVAIGYLFLCFKEFPILKRNIVFKRKMVRPLLTFGGWVTVSNIISPILVSLDRFLIGSLLTMEAVAYYSAPYEAVTRLFIIPASLAMIIFPSFSKLEATGEGQKIEILFARSIRYVILTVGPIVLILEFFAKEILQIWLGKDFATESAFVLQILALGIMFNSLAQMPFSFVQGLGRPDITAKFHLIELPIYVTIAWIFIKQWGISGAAIAWALRMALDALLLFIASIRIYRLSPNSFSIYGIAGTLLILFFPLFLIFLFKNISIDFFFYKKAIFFLVLIGFYLLFIWKEVLSTIDRSAIKKFAKIKI
jgi:O-antigen/teichoic acid export membrane protein